MKIRNIDIFPLENFLRTVEGMNAKASRARTKLVNSLSLLGKEYTESQKQLVTELGGQIDNDLKIIFSKDNQKAKLEADTDLTELANEVVTIDEFFDGQFKVLKEFFAEWDGVVSAMHANAYDTFLELLEEEK